MRIIETDPVTRVLKHATYIQRQTHTHRNTNTQKHTHIQAHTHRHATMQWILFKYSRNRFKCFCNASVLLCKELFYYIFQRITISSSAEYDVTFHFFSRKYQNNIPNNFVYFPKYTYFLYLYIL